MSDGSTENLGITSFPRFFVLPSAFGCSQNVADKAQVRKGSGVSSLPRAFCITLVKNHSVPSINNNRTDNLFQDFRK